MRRLPVTEAIVGWMICGQQHQQQNFSNLITISLNNKNKESFDLTALYKQYTIKIIE